MHCQNKHYKNILLEFNRLTVYVSASEWHLFPKGDNNYNEIEFSLANIEVLNSKVPQNLSQWNANRYILFLTMFVLHFN